MEREFRLQKGGAGNTVRILSAAIAQSPDMVFITDTAGTIEYVNRRFTEMTGFMPEEVIGNTPRLFQSGETPPEVYADLWATLMSGEVWRHDIQNRRKDGSLYWAHVTIWPIRSTDGTPTHYVATHEDISQRKVMEEQIKRYAEDVETARQQTEAQAVSIVEMAEKLAVQKDLADRASRAKSEMLANMSHELRTPLNAIIGFSDMIRQEVFGPVGGDKYQDYAQDIFRSGSHLLDLINDILDVSAIEAGKVELKKENIDVADLVDEVLFMVKVRADEGGVVLSADHPDRFPPLNADRRRMKQTLINLLSNAIKFTPAGGSVTLEVEIEDAQAYLFRVRDTGIGMDGEGVAKAMTPFGQVDSGLNRKYEGTGLGLPLTKGLVELHGGEMVIESEPGKGTTVTVLLPLAA